MSRGITILAAAGACALVVGGLGWAVAQANDSTGPTPATDAQKANLTEVMKSLDDQTKPGAPAGTVAYQLRGVRLLPVALSSHVAEMPKITSAQAETTVWSFVAADLLPQDQQQTPTIQLVFYRNDVAGEEKGDGTKTLDHQDELSWAVTYRLGKPPVPHLFTPASPDAKWSTEAPLDLPTDECQTVGIVNATTGIWSEVFTTCVAPKVIG